MYKSVDQNATLSHASVIKGNHIIEVKADGKRTEKTPVRHDQAEEGTENGTG